MSAPICREEGDGELKGAKKRLPLPPGVQFYTDRDGSKKWRVDIWIETEGQYRRFRKKGIPTKEMAVSIVAKARTEALENRFLGTRTHAVLTVLKAWEQYEPISIRDKRSSGTDRSRAKHFVEHLGNFRVESITQRVIDRYRAIRRAETTPFGKCVSVAQVNREVALLRRVFSYAHECGDIEVNPLMGIKLLKEDNIRQVALSEADFEKLVSVAQAPLIPILYTAFDTGMRKAEILNLKWSQVDLNAGLVKLYPENTKSSEPRNIYLTPRVIEQLKSVARSISGYVFVNPETNRPWNQIKKMFERAREKAGLGHIWFHDLRRSFVTNARKRGVSESVVMRMSGHKTRAVFDRYNVVDDADLQRAMTLILAGQDAEKQAKKQAEEQVQFGHFLDTVRNSIGENEKASQVST